MLSVPSERSLPARTLEVLRLVDRVARELRVAYFVTGAIARDILLHGVFGIDPGRGTLDVDLAVAVQNWPQFELIKTRLVATNAFTAEERMPHRLFHREDASEKAYPLDLLPFGGIEQPPNKLVWPPELSIVVNVAGYREALAAAQDVEVATGFVVPVASLPGLAILKLLAWADRGIENPKDAVDLVTLLRWYGGAGNEDRLFGEEMSLLESLGYNMDLAGPQLLGKDAARITTTGTRNLALALLDDAVTLERLTRDMARAFRGAEDPIGEAEAFIAQFKTGLQAASP
jgi:predicted nucleotidyltransferase